MKLAPDQAGVFSAADLLSPTGITVAKYSPNRLRDIAARAAITERSAYGIVTDLAEAGYVVKQKDGRRDRYPIQAHLPLPEPTSRERTIGEILALLAGADATP